jgi:DNA mismatch repair protein MutL
MHLFLNRRLIKDRLLTHAVMSGYRNLLMKDQYPFVVLSLEIQPHLVDVNVHPTKREVRFVQPNVIHQFVSHAIGKYLSQAPWAKGSSQALESREPFAEKGEVVLGPALPYKQPTEIQGWEPETRSPQLTADNWQPRTDNFSRIGRLPFSSLSVIGQLKGTYILCQTEEHLVSLDQHAAHERIGFEKLREAHRSGKVQIQQLLVPQMVEVNEAEKETLSAHLDSLKSLGVVIEEFGPTTFIVKGTPAILGNFEVEPLLKELMEDLESHGSSTKLEDHLDELFATMACHRQIRAGDHLSPREMQELVNELDEGAHTYHCPHGRPVMVQIGFREIEKWFKRVL